MIKDYFVIGDLHSAGLVSRTGSIDWLCLPHFDSPSLFGRMLDESAGHFSINNDGYEVKANYAGETAIVNFTFNSPNNSFEVHDFMIPSATKICESHFLVRKIIGKTGWSEVEFHFAPMSDYGKSAVDFNQQKDRLQFTVNGNDVVLYLPQGCKLTAKNNGYDLKIPIQAGQHKNLVLEYIEENQLQKPIDFEKEQATKEFWQAWVAKGTFFDFSRDKLVRSAITLKLMQFYPTGAIVAAPTTSLPEHIGGLRNWDYRYVWIRDATFTLYALYVLGYTEEAERFFDFIDNITKHETFDVALMYTIDGAAMPFEQTLEHLQGYENSQPVRVGNDAARQFQLDVYGSLLDAYYFSLKRGLKYDEVDKNMVLKLVKCIKNTWQQPDHGIWEMRGQQQHFTYSKAMAWVGADRALRLADTLQFSESEKQLCADLASDIKDWIWHNCYDEINQTFRQHPDTDKQDATNFLLVLLQFLDKKDPRTKTIVEKTCGELSYKDVFVYRYKTDDKLPGQEGAFLLCSFWLIAAWAILDETDWASELFAKLEKLLAENGLLAEEIDPETSRYLGNYPQAFSHVGYIMSTYYIHKYSQRKTKN